MPLVQTHPPRVVHEVIHLGGGMAKCRCGKAGPGPINSIGSHVFAKAIARDKHRESCTVCGKPFKYYELEPGSGRCPACST